MAYGFLSIAVSGGATLYPPDHHREFVEMIFGAVGLRRSFSRPPEVPARAGDATPLIKVTVVSPCCRAEIEIHRSGEETVPAIKEILKALRRKKIKQITLCLNLEDPGTASLCGEMEELGFFIAGVLPRSPVGDALILQYLNDVPIDYDKIEVASDLLEEIKAYVRDHAR